MAKKKVSYECMACGYESAKYLGKCPNCGAWNQMEEQIVQSTIKTEKSQFKVLTQRGEGANRAQRLEEITYKATTPPPNTRSNSWKLVWVRVSAL